LGAGKAGKALDFGCGVLGGDFVWTWHASTAIYNDWMGFRGRYCTVKSSLTIDTVAHGFRAAEESFKYKSVHFGKCKEW